MRTQSTDGSAKDGNGENRSRMNVLTGQKIETGTYCSHLQNRFRTNGWESGAVCTVLDYSPLQLESERMVAEREGYDIRIIRGDMTKRLPFEDGEFDIIFHPVSNCYVEDVRPIWRECFRILRPGGRLLAGTDHYINYIVDSEEKRIVNSLPFRHAILPFT